MAIAKEVINNFTKSVIESMKKNGIRCATTFYKRAIDIFLNDNNYRWKEGK